MVEKITQSFSTPRPLCLSFWTPPLIRPQAILIEKMIPEWIKQGVKPVVAGYKNNGDWILDASIHRLTPWNINKYASRIPFLVKILKNKYYLQTALQLGNIIKKEKPNLIFSFANPQDSNILGAKLKEKFKLPFISHFSDPWFDNPYSHWSPTEKNEIKKLEEYIIFQSDQVVFVNEELRDLVMKKFPNTWKNKTSVIPHCFSQKDYPERQKIANKTFTLSHIGAFYKKRTPELLFSACNVLLQKNPSLAGTFKIELVGAINQYTGFPETELKKLIHKYQVSEQISLIPPVDYRQSLSYMKNSDCLIVIDADIPNSPFLPSKVIDYVGSSTPILGISPSGSPTSSLLKRLGQPVFTYEQKNDLIQYLQNLFQEKRLPLYSEKTRSQYAVENTTAQLVGLFKKVTTL